MTRQIKRVKITTLRRQTIKRAESLVRTHCQICEREVVIVTRSQAAGILEVDDIAFDQFITNGQVHLIQTISGNLWICRDSLFSR